MKRLGFMVIGAFWVLMNVLLWRVEISGTGETGVPLSPQKVIDRILTAPDPSPLVILRNGKRIGYCRWIPTIIEASSDQTTASQTNKETTVSEPEGWVRQIGAYWLDTEGYVQISPRGLRIRFSSHLELTPKKEWTHLSIKVRYGHDGCEIQADAQQEILSILFWQGEQQWRQVWKFEELKDPRQWLARFGPGILPVWREVIQQMKSMWKEERVQTEASSFELGLQWKAWEEWVDVGPSRTRAYRLESRLFGDRKISLVLTRVGEILRLDLPDRISLVNENLYRLTQFHHD